MNQRKLSKIVIAVGLCIILVLPFVMYPSSTTDREGENIDLQEMEANVSNPGCFIENKGQIGNDEILFYSEIPGGLIGFAEGKVLLWSHDHQNVIELSFPGGNAVSPRAHSPVSAYFNYILGHRGTFTHLRGYEGVVFEDLWSGIDLVYKNTADGAKYEFQVAPGANPSDIRVRCDGHDDLVINDVDITIGLDEKRFRDIGLLVSQTDGRTVPAIYQSYDEQTYGVEVGCYDQSEALIVDPLIFSTYLGGANEDAGYSTVVDAQGNIIVGGWTWSSNFPTESAYNSTYGGGMECFVAKLDSGGDLLYSTFIGGSGSEYVAGVDVDNDDGQIIVSASTSSQDFPTTAGAMNETSNGEYDVAVFRLTAAGDDLVFSTYVGGSSHEAAYDVATMRGMSGLWIYVTGYTMSPDFPTKQWTPGWNKTYTAGKDIMVFVLSPDGTELGWSNLVGGSGDDTGTNIGLDDYWWVMVTGYTDSDDLPTDETTWNPYDDEYNGDLDCFCLGFNRFGNELGFLTYIGGVNNDRGYGLAVTSGGESFITGITSSDDFPVTDHAYDSSYNLDGDAFVLKVSADGTNLDFATYVGGAYEERGNSVMIDSSGNLIVAGRTSSSDFPTLHAYDSTHNGGIDGFLLRITDDGRTLLSSTFFGGSGDEYVSHCLANDTDDNIFVTGGTYSTNFPIVGSQAYDDTHNGDEDVFVICFSADFSYPEFHSVTRSIANPDNQDTVEVTAVITDPEGLAEVTLHYSTDTTSEEVTMVNNPFESNNWTASIPAYPVNTNVTYYVTAIDDAGNQAVSSEDMYQIEPPPPLVIDQGLIIALVSLSAAALGIVGGLIKLRAVHIERSIKSTKESEE